MKQVKGMLNVEMSQQDFNDYSPMADEIMIYLTDYLIGTPEQVSQNMGVL